MSGESLRHLLYDTYDEILTIVHTILLAIVRFVSCVYNFGIQVYKVIMINIMSYGNLLSLPNTRFLTQEIEDLCFIATMQYLR